MNFYLYHHLFNIQGTGLTDWLTAIGTVGAVIVALFTPWLVNWLTNRPKKSKLVAMACSVIDQDTAVDEYNKNIRRILHVGRIILRNDGKYKAVSAEAYIEKVIFKDKEREDFIPMPLIWTHGQLNKNGHTIRDIYPNQTVYLDIYNHIYDDGYTNDNVVSFAVAAGQGNGNLSLMNIGSSELLIKIYQESGQVNIFRLKCGYDGKGAPSISII